MKEKNVEQDMNDKDRYNSKITNRKKLNFYSTVAKKMVHIKLANGEFRNCHIQTELSPGIWKVIERKLGEIHLFEDEIKDIDEYVELNNEDDKT
jgi:hypothetical protein